MHNRCARPYAGGRPDANMCLGAGVHPDANMCPGGGLRPDAHVRPSAGVRPDTTALQAESVQAIHAVGPVEFR